MAAAQGGGEWTITAVYTDARGHRHEKATFELRWADSFATGTWHPGHLGEALQGAFRSAKKRAFPAWKAPKIDWRKKT